MRWSHTINMKFFWCFLRRYNYSYHYQEKRNDNNVHWVWTHYLLFPKTDQLTSMSLGSCPKVRLVPMVRCCNKKIHDYFHLHNIIYTQHQCDVCSAIALAGQSLNKLHISNLWRQISLLFSYTWWSVFQLRKWKKGGKEVIIANNVEDLHFIKL